MRKHRESPRDLVQNVSEPWYALLVSEMEFAEMLICAVGIFIGYKVEFQILEYDAFELHHEACPRRSPVVMLALLYVLLAAVLGECAIPCACRVASVLSH